MAIIRDHLLIRVYSAKMKSINFHFGQERRDSLRSINFPHDGVNSCLRARGSIQPNSAHGRRSRAPTTPVITHRGEIRAPKWQQLIAHIMASSLCVLQNEKPAEQTVEVAAKDLRLSAQRLKVGRNENVLFNGATIHKEFNFVADVQCYYFFMLG